MENLPDEQLVKLAAKADSLALEVLVARHLQGLYRFCFGYLKDRAEAEDAVQEIFVKVWRALGKFDQTKIFKPWLYGIAKHACLDSLKKKRIIAFSDWEDKNSEASLYQNFSDISKSPEQQLDSSLLSQKLSKAIGQLSPKYAQVVALRHGRDLNFREISAITGKPINTVKSRYHRAVGLLKGLFGRFE